MAAPSMVSRDGENTLVKSLDAVFGASEDEGEENESSIEDGDGGGSQEGGSGVEEQDPMQLPQCKIKRNYSCANCDYYTQNPRFYLYHQKHVHKEKIKIFECPHCLYASKHSQKLQRHIHMVHVMGKKKIAKTKARLLKQKAARIRRLPPPPPLPSPPQPLELSQDPDPDPEDEEDKPEPIFAADGTQVYKCSVCDMTSKSETLVARHERVVHLKKKFFRCNKCNYMTHMKARYTKHVKYHSMPMIKCDMCDFKTPYKWNLDRHNKNHQGDGAFKCVMCNFAADIKQSLTVHEMNHHVPPVGHISGNRRRLRVGASDTMGMLTEEDGIDQDELDLLRLEREGSLEQLEQNPADFLQTQLEESPTPLPQPMVKFSMRQVLVPVGDMATPNRSLSSSGFIRIQKYKCKVCDYSGNLGEVQRHEATEHGVKDLQANLNSIKRPRPIPNLIPIQGQSVLKPPSERLSETSNSSFTQGNDENKQMSNSVPGSKSNSPTPQDDRKFQESFKRKNASFFDKLKEKLMTNATERDLTCNLCGFEAKCLSEHLKHQKSHSEVSDEEHSSSFSQGELSSTRCQHCRHRCKTSVDLMIHLRTCSAINNNADSNFPSIKSEPEDFEEGELKIHEPEDDEMSNSMENHAVENHQMENHPMENKVFVWNNFQQNPEPKTPAPFELNFYHRGEERMNEMPHRMPQQQPNCYPPAMNGGPPPMIRYQDNNYPPRETTRKVFKCPNCSFWASTASRFHVHIVGHLNKRPFQCSLCHYSSNWRWDITKHIRLKQMRDSAHEKARVLLTDEAGRRNYSKYNKYLISISAEEFKKAQTPRQKGSMPKENSDPCESKKIGTKRPVDKSNDEDEETPKKKIFPENKKTMWKCKKCLYRNVDRAVVLAHVKEHYRSLADIKAAMPQDNQQEKQGEENSKASERSPEKNNLPQNDDIECPDFMCETCPYSCESLEKLEEHAERHFVTQGSNIKCQFCPYYAEKSEQLLEHLDLHDNSDAADEANKNVVYACLVCPYVGSTHQQLVYHRKWHNKDLPHKCFKCDYSTHTNIVLSLHVRLHGRGVSGESSDSNQSPKKSESVISADISGINTSNFPDIPMVWVSKPMGISKMFKCRYCPHVNMRKTNIQEHEKMHSLRLQNGTDDSIIQHHCPDCNYICNNAGVLSSHMKVHQAFFGQVCGVVDHKIPDEEQIEDMKRKVTEYEINLKIKNGEDEFSDSPPKEETQINEFDSRDGLLLHFCPVCPARFLFLKEVIIHQRFHDLNLPFKCESCSYTARQKQHLMAHLKVHTDDYQERTTSLCNLYPIDRSYPKPKVVVVLGEPSISSWNWKVNESVWVVVKSEKPDKAEDSKDSHEKEKKKKKPLTCDKCPAEFFKELALSYHMSLHGGPGPHKCKYCDYAVKTYGNLLRHEAVHANNESPIKLSLKAGETPISGTELFKQKTEAQKGSPQKPIPAPMQEDPEFGHLIFGNPDFVYPTYVKNGKLREKRYKCHKCPSAFEKREQYKIHLSLHGSRQRYSCDKCDYSVKYFANFSQHVKKHNQHEATKKQVGNEPIIEDREDEIPETPISERSGKSMNMSVADRQTMMLMQNKSITGNISREALNGEISRCPHCPYANTRKDGVSSHIKCHSNTRGGAYTCKYCDYNVPQLHFLREHLKVHFTSIKYLKPDAYMKCDRLELWSEPVDSNHNNEKTLIFKDQGTGKKERFLPSVESNDDFENFKGRVYINLKTGEEEVEMDDEEEETEEDKKINGVQIKQEEEEPEEKMVPPEPKIVENGISEKMEVDEDLEGDEEESSTSKAPSSGIEDEDISSDSSSSDDDSSASSSTVSSIVTNTSQQD